MHPDYFLHGDQEDSSDRHFFCRKCDVFAESSHFQEADHIGIAEKMLLAGLTYLAGSEKQLRQNDWPNLFERELLVVRFDFESKLAKLNRRKQISPSTRFAILKRDESTCQLCGRGLVHGVTLHVDHRLALANGGTNDFENLWTLCADCNLGKGVSDL